MIAEFRIILRNLKPFGVLRILKILRPAIDINNNGIVKFVFDDVGFFDPFYESKIIDIVLITKHFNKNIFFCNIYIFIN